MEDGKKSIMNIGGIKGTWEKLQQVEMLTQLGLQVNGGFSRNMNSKTLSAPNLSGLDISHSDKGLVAFGKDGHPKIYELPNRMVIQSHSWLPETLRYI